MSNSFTFNGIDLGGTTYGLTIQRRPHVMSPDAVIASSRVAYRNGDISFQRMTGARKITVPFVVIGTSASNLRTKLDNIVLALNETDDKQLKFDVWSDRYYLAKLASMDVSEMFGLSAEGTLSFICSDPNSFSTSLTQQTNDPHSDTGFNAPASSVIAGTAVSEPVVYFRPNTGAGTVTDPFSLLIMPNAQTVEVTFDGGFVCGADKWMRFHCGLKRVQIATGDGTKTPPTTGWTDAMTGVTGVFPKLIPGIQNVVTLASGIAAGSGSTSSVCILSYRARYQ